MKEVKSMLKIKDNVNLKELEKFGFEKVNEGWYAKDVTQEGRDAVVVIEAQKNQILRLFVESYIGRYVQIDSTLYDLIQAGLVEKIEGGK